MTEHTEGPWEVWENGRERYIRQEDGAIVARDGKQFEEDTNLANARLIAAAPDLYEALKDLLYARTPDRSRHNRNRVVRDRAHKALEKAEWGQE